MEDQPRRRPTPSHATSGDIIEELVANIDDQENAYEIANRIFNQMTDADFNGNYADLVARYADQPDVGDILNQMLEEDAEELTPTGSGAPRLFRVGAAYKGVKVVVEEENDHVYKPSSDYCYIKCVNKYLELTGSSTRIPTTKLSPYEPTLKAIRVHIANHYKKCEHDNCKDKACKKARVDRVKLETPPVIVAYWTGTEVMIRVIDKKTANVDRPSICLLHMGNSIYHAILVKITNPRTLTREDITMKFARRMEVIADTTKLSDFRFKAPLRFVISYDIETYTYKTIKEYKTNEVIGTTTNEKGRTVNSYRVDKQPISILKPYALGWRIIEVETGKHFSKYYEVIAKRVIKEGKTVPTPDGDLLTTNIFDEFFDQLHNFKGDELSEGCFDNGLPPVTQIYAHNGGKFDNIYARHATNIKIKSAIKKGFFYKTIKLFHNDDKQKQPRIYELKDTLPFSLQSLKESCKTFKTGVAKIDFDIVDKSFEWYEARLNATSEEDNWKRYLQYDVDSLAALIYRMDQSFKEFGVSITNFAGLPGIAFYVMMNYCHGLKYLRVPKDPSLKEFYAKSIYGGRVVQWKREFDSRKELIRVDPDGTSVYDTLVSIDMNSLYPSVMYAAAYPAGDPKTIQDDYIKRFNTDPNIEILNNFPHYIVEVSISVPNIKYAYHPYKTDDGMLIYPSNQVIQGVYNDVDLKEMAKDGYKITQLHRGIYFRQTKRVFTGLIDKLYNMRKVYKALPDDNPEQSKEYIVKILLNAMYGKFNETIKTTTSYKANEGEINESKGGFTAQKLANGQYEVCARLFNPMVRKPTYIAGYVTAYSRQLMNEIIRKIGPENVYYSDTDSLYLKKSVLDAMQEPFNSNLCGFKNDYGDSNYIEYALFLDMKRYYLELKDDKNNITSFKAKFNGLAFKALDHISDFAIKETDKPFSQLRKEYQELYSQWDDPKNRTEELKERIHNHPRYIMLMLRKLYQAFLDNYNIKSEKAKYIQANRSMSKEDIEHNWSLNKDWIANTNMQCFKLAIDRFIKSGLGVVIDKKEFIFQIDPEKRGQWIDNTFYSLGFDLTKEEYIPDRSGLAIGDLVKQGSEVTIDTHSTHTKENIMYLSSNLPLMYKKEEQHADAYIKVEQNTKDNYKVTTQLKSNFYMTNLKEIVFVEVDYDFEKKHGKPGPLVIDVDEENGITFNKKMNVYGINAFGRISDLSLIYSHGVTHTFKLIEPIIAIEDTKENIQKYGENYVTVKELVTVLSKMRDYIKKRTAEEKKAHQAIIDSYYTED